MASNSVLSFSSRLSFQLVADVEVILNRAFAATGDDDDLVAPGGDGLFHAVLNDRLIDQRQHLFGLCLGRGQKSGTQPAAGKTAFLTVCFIAYPRWTSEFKGEAQLYREATPVRIRLVSHNFPK